MLKDRLWGSPSMSERREGVRLVCDLDTIVWSVVEGLRCEVPQGVIQLGVVQFDVQDHSKIATGNGSVVRSQGKQIQRQRA